MKMNAINKIYCLIIFLSLFGKLVSQEKYHFIYQFVDPDNPNFLLYEYNELTPTEKMSITVDSTVKYEPRKDRIIYDEEGMPEKVIVGPSTFEELNTSLPLYENRELGFIIRTVTYPKDFLSDIRLIPIKEELINFDWEITDEVKEIGGKRSIKATAQWRCKEYIAWFSPEINVSAGPSIFHGLPGLIIRLEKEGEDGYYELREFGTLKEQKLSLEKLGFEPEKRHKLKTHCDLESAYKEYVEVLNAWASTQSCRDVQMTIDKMKWHECWDECD